MEPTIPIDNEKIQIFCEKWKIKEFYLFGSVLQDDFGPESDVDVLIRISDYTGIGLYEWMDMIEELQTIFGRKVDLVSADSVNNPFIRLQISQNRRLIHAA